MILLDYDWIRAGLVFLCFTSFIEAHVGYNIAGNKHPKDATVPASTTLLYRNNLNQLSFPSFTRDQLFRIQRHTYMRPLEYLHYNGVAAKNHLFPDQFNLYDPFAVMSVADYQNLDYQPYNSHVSPAGLREQTQFIGEADTIKDINKLNAPTTLKMKEHSSTKTPDTANILPIQRKSLEPKPKPSITLSKIFVRQEKLRQKKLRQKKNKINTEVKNLKSTTTTIKLKLSPLLDVSFKQDDEPTFDTNLLRKKQTNKSRGGSRQITENLLSRFKVYQAIPDEDF